MTFARPGDPQRAMCAGAAFRRPFAATLDPGPRQPISNEVRRETPIGSGGEAVRDVRAVLASGARRFPALPLVVLALLALGACTAMKHDRGGDSCYCYSDLTGGSSAAVGHEWKL